MKKHGILFLCVLLSCCTAFTCGCGENNAAAELKTTEIERDETIETPKDDNGNETNGTPTDGTSTNETPDGESDDAASAERFFFEETDGAIMITGLTEETVSDIVIPRKINGLPVKAISDGAFINRKDLKTLSVPACVEKIGYGALSGCSAIVSVTLPFTGAEHRTEKGLNDYNFGYIFGETPYSDGRSAMQFYHKDDAEQVELVYYYIPSSLKEVKITGVKNTHIPYAAFYNCNTIDKIILGQNITDIGEFAFSGVTGKIEWEAPQIKTVGEHAFEDFKGEELTIPDSVTEIKRSAYSACVNVKNFVIPDSVKKADIYAFSYNYELQSVTVGKNLETLPVETFYFCINLKNVAVTDGLKVIEDGAFDSCKALAAIDIPATVTRINANAFRNCRKLKSVRFHDAEGWRYYGILTSGDYFAANVLSDAATAARYLTDTFRDYIWEKTPR